MPGVGFKPTTPVFEWAKTVHALDRAATVFGAQLITQGPTLLFTFTMGLIHKLT
jgi:hypothetical protein